MNTNNFDDNFDDNFTSDCLWDFIDKPEFETYLLEDDNKLKMEGWFYKSIKYILGKPIDLLKVNIKKTRSGLYFNIYDKNKQIGHASFHHDMGYPGSLSHIVDDKDKNRRDVDMERMDDTTLIFRLKKSGYDVYNYFNSIASSLTYTFSRLINDNSIVYI